MLLKIKSPRSAVALAILGCLNGVAASVAQAQDAAAEGATNKADARAESIGLEEIVVTGTRIIRDNYSAPTPVMMIGAEDIEAKAPQNVADLLNEMPSVAGSQAPRNTVGSPAFSITGLNTVNLRNLGSNRTLILLDGYRTVPSNVSGFVDVNNIPQQLIKRIDIVTGGASSAYGSDAVAGVVNFVLDHDFTGVKAEVQGGETTYGDGRNWKVAVSSGFGFADDRGHVLLSGETARADGIVGFNRREWANQGIFAVPNPAYVAGNGQPQYIVTPQAMLAIATNGGIITNTALRGTAFGPGGSPYRFNYGTPAGSNFAIGGDWRSNQFLDQTSIDPEEERDNLFARTSFKLTDNIELFGLFNYGKSRYPSSLFPQFSLGNIVVKNDNPFIPAAVAAQMATLGITQFSMGSMNRDLPPVKTQQGRSVGRYQVGANGSFELVGRDWSWDVFYERGVAKEEDRGQMRITPRFALALDAVRDPATGAIVCRSTLTDPTNGCVPYNPMGTGVNSQAAIDYLIGENTFDLTFKQNTAAANLQGEPFSTWAGPVSIATGFEYRNQKVTSYGNPFAEANQFIGSNYKAIAGKLNVKEGYLETVIPLAADLPGVKTLEFNGAVRFTDYSTSGMVTTWKGGVTYAPIADARLRVTRSRDIRAPNIRELFGGGGTTGTGSIVNPFPGNTQPATVLLTAGGGNPNLEPEVAETLGLGVVLTPSWAAGLTASVDYYSIKLDGAIGQITAQQIVDRCYLGNQSLCNAITFNGVNIERVFGGPLNFQSQEVRGIDLDLTYTHALLGGRMTVHALASHYLESSLNDSASTIDGVGVLPRDWHYRATLAYDRQPIALSLTGRGFTDGLINATYVECASGCPASTGANPTINTNRAAGAFYLDAAVTYKFRNREGEASGAEAFFTVSNLLNKDPAVYGASGVGSITGTFNSPVNTVNPIGGSSASLYDVLGRVYRVGMRLRM